ncbi:hypothetical protein [Paenibacillus eucommiae]|uniref:Two-component sensor histidine kinase n=1 Tax=Paenibacillus eucommiae TaxID=1355755 RepID=A0ABS4IMC4_9BACL|nr:hypothetical protein [Paenibacillus eucommiae]MBP1988684.1 hypothetical protein [Paenibacillus eucommiae]
MNRNALKLFLIFSPLLICLTIGIVITYQSLEDGKLLNRQNLREYELNAQYNKIILQYEDVDLLTFYNVFI